MSRRDFTARWAAPAWMLLPDPIPEDFVMCREFRIAAMSIQVVRGEIRPMRVAGLADG